MHALSTTPKDGKLYAIKGYIGIKIRYLKQSNAHNDWSYYIYYRAGAGRENSFCKKSVQNPRA